MMLRQGMLGLSRSQTLSYRFVRTSMQTQRLTQQLLIPTTLRMVHARGYNSLDDGLIHDWHEINCALASAKSTDNIVAVYKLAKGDEAMTPEQIAHGFWFIAVNKLEKTPDFWNYIIPLVKKQMLTLDRQTTSALFRAIEGAAGMYL